MKAAMMNRGSEATATHTKATAAYQLMAQAPPQASAKGPRAMSPIASMNGTTERRMWVFDLLHKRSESSSKMGTSGMLMCTGMIPMT
eukprot:CAMPEP_0177257666 /NCGR_PEP_ID=MMETSP0367-20130122/57671_1 /TAXON_ID=447022 ORGANISM="Scrippsiella hangoei-like, Strain SHHI-4" /NCGR_SAMPLE_ID=MMETSP0367 /ASSEMBLY_ACC=CAM_ASM_000362 /LENGTH=86 /DNA_ID=CAMNT_0018711781 /DNA_START=37 /DNA_END=297 /DNA_ORIENTATION=-